ILIIIQMVPAIFAGLKKSVGEAISPKAHIGLIDVSGLIMDSEKFVKQLNVFLEQKHIKGIILKINSPGGAPGASQIMYKEILRAKEKKPVVALVENACASGGYYIASAANKIIAPELSLIGSIGVLTMSPNVKELAKDWKIDVNITKAGKYKTVGNPFAEVQSDEEKAYLQVVTDDMYDQFVGDVAKSRNIDRAEHQKWADGKIFSGRQALKLRLIDQVGGWSDAKEEIRKLACIKTEIKLVRQPRPSAFASFMGGADDGADTHLTSFVSSLAQMFSMKKQCGLENLPMYGQTAVL
ncbi:signal peptide peptidase SppA, partial [Candidatus Babeliales bacterium]|nr:signal peptide peptidase SppA [Candidatus Babeliales bacterium]